MGETEPGADVDTTAILLISGALYLWGVLSGRLERDDLTAPIVFVAIGGMLAVTGLIAAPAAGETLKPLVEVTLVWVLFSDAAGVPFGEMRRDLGRIVRLLAVGLPLTVLAGWALAYWLFPQLGVWLALLVAAALAPTDAALGLPVVTNRAVPSRIRRLITVESGLNDGIVTPIVMFALAGAVSAEALDGAPGMGEALAELGIGLVVGAGLGLGGGSLLRWARRRGWAAEDFVGIAVLASHSRPMRPPLLFTETGSSRRFAEASPSVRPRGPGVRPNWCSWSRPAAWCPCWSGWRSVRCPSRSSSNGSTSSSCCMPSSA
jgi:sodium/hydrogen antiporter